LVKIDARNFELSW